MKTALNGIRIAAFTHFAAGPIAAQYLGALGADVIKVESPKRDLNRYAVTDVEDSLNGVSPYFVCTNRNQRGIILDLKSEAGKDVARRIIASSDVVLENYRPGVLDRLGLGYDDSRKLKSDIIYCSFSAYDATGSACDRPGQDLLMQATSGLASLSGRASDMPVPVGAYVIDGFTAMQGVIGILSALHHRDVMGEGQWVRADMMSTALYMMTQEASFVMNARSMTERASSGVAHVNQGAPYGIYRASDGPIALSVFGGVEVVGAIAKALNLDEELASSLSERGLKVDRDIIAASFQREIGRMTISEATERLTSAGAWVAPVRTLSAALDDPVIQEPGTIRDYDTPIFTKHRVVTEPLQMSETPLVRDRPAPGHGEHTEAILLDIGYSDAQIAKLIGSKAAQNAA